MKLNIEPIRNWFGFTRRERRSSFILLVIVVLILSLRFAVPEQNILIEDISDSISYSSETKSIYETYSNNEDKYISLVKKKNNSDFRSIVTSQKSAIQVVNLNNCDTSQLIALPGIGPVLSVRIIKYRNLLGGYASVDQLKEVYGLPAETFELIRARVYADTTLLKRISINSAGYPELSKLRYLERYEVSSILKYRDLNGRIKSIDDLTSNKLITNEKAVKIEPYLKFD